MPGAVGLGFEPVKDRQVPEIKGTLWVDRASAELRALEYEYVNVPSTVRAPGLGGRSEFARLAGGGWIIRDWYIRMPDRVDFQRRPAARRDVRTDSIVGYVDDGGSARPLGDASVLVGEAAARTSGSTSVTLHEVRLRVVSSSGAPIEGALIAIAELDSTVSTGPGGQVRLTDVAEKQLRLRLRAIGHAPTSAVIALPGAQRTVDTTLPMAVMAQRLDSIVVTEAAVPVRGKMEGFEQRRKEGFGRFLTLEDLEDPLRGKLDLQLRKLGRVRLMPIGYGGYAAAALKPNEMGDVCYMTIYVDGVPIPAPVDLRHIQIKTLQGVEVYHSQAELPPQYTGPACGVILLWTK
jgi:hypothetical protein